MKKIQIMGTGCPTCMKLYDLARGVVAEAGLEAEVEKVTDMQEMLKAGVMTTPALVVDGKVLSTGRAVTRDELKGMLGIA